ncbi:MAG: VIT1/CCC1 transporter family protein, partial [Pseudomonadota bacterium]
CAWGPAVPLAAAWGSPASLLSAVVEGSSRACLAALGGLAAWVGGAGAIRGAARVTFWGALAMAATAAVGGLFGVVA